jgi:hypothetical protein
MLIILPNKCLYCHEDIDREWGEGLIQMSCDVHGFPPFEITATMSWCSIEHFLEWWKKNLGALNATMGTQEALEKALMKNSQSSSREDKECY